MAWVAKYRTEFKNDNNDLFRLDIEEEDFAGSLTELNSGANPVEIISDEGGYLTPVIGSGLSINLISATPLQLIGLNVVNKFANRVELFKNSILVWQGWLNSEEYQEVYSEYKNYHVSFTANDGLALLDDVKLLDASGDRLIGILPAHDLILFILGKIQLDDIMFHIADSFKIYENDETEITHTSTETYLSSININLDNYINEKSEAMSCREVLDGVLQSLGLMLRNNALSLSSGTNIDAGFMIYDTNVITAEAAVTFKVYNAALTYDSSWSLGTTDLTYDLENDLEYTNTGSSLSFAKTINSQEIVFSNYQLVEVINTTVNKEELTVSTKSERSPGSGCGDDNRWSEWVYSGITNFSLVDTSNIYVAQKVDGVDGITPTHLETEDYYIASLDFTPTTQNDILFETDVETPVFFKGYDGTYSDYATLGLLINYDLMIAEDKCADDDASEIDAFTIGLKITVGTDEYWMNSHFGKTNSKVATEEYVQPETDRTKPDDTRKGALLHFARGSNNVIDPGLVKLSFTKSTSASLGGLTNTARYRFKNFSVQVVSSDAIAYTYDEFTSGTDIAETGTINPDSSNFGDEINLIHGTGTTGGIERGQFMYEHPTVTGTYFNLSNINKGVAASGLMTVEQWLFSKIFSNQYAPSVQLGNISIKASDVEQANIARITDVNQFPSKVFMITGYVYRPYENEIIYTLREINNDNYTT